MKLRMMFDDKSSDVATESAEALALDFDVASELESMSSPSRSDGLTMPLSSVIHRAVDLVKRGWAHSAMARDLNGNSVDALGMRASHYCAVGALRRALAEAGSEDPEGDARNIGEPLAGVESDLMAFNDYPIRQHQCLGIKPRPQDMRGEHVVALFEEHANCTRIRERFDGPSR